MTLKVEQESSSGGCQQCQKTGSVSRPRLVLLLVVLSLCQVLLVSVVTLLPARVELVSTETFNLFLLEPDIANKTSWAGRGGGRREVSGQFVLTPDTSSDSYYSQVSPGISCFTQGTDLVVSGEKGECVCTGRYGGRDCGIPNIIKDGKDMGYLDEK